MLRILASTFALMALGGLTPRAAAAQATYTCGAPTGTTPETMLSGLRRLLSGGAVSDSAWRATAKLPQTAPTNVTIVTADSVCDTAARAVAALATPSGTISRVWVIAVDTSRYVVFGAARQNYATAAVFDTNFTWLADF